MDHLHGPRDRIGRVAHFREDADQFMFRPALLRQLVRLADVLRALRFGLLADGGQIHIVRTVALEAVGVDQFPVRREIHAGERVSAEADVLQLVQFLRLLLVSPGELDLLRIIQVRGQLVLRQSEALLIEEPVRIQARLQRRIQRTADRRKDRPADLGLGRSEDHRLRRHFGRRGHFCRRDLFADGLLQDLRRRNLFRGKLFRDVLFRGGLFRRRVVKRGDLLGQCRLQAPRELLSGRRGLLRGRRLHPERFVPGLRSLIGIRPVSLVPLRLLEALPDHAPDVIALAVFEAHPREQVHVGTLSARRAGLNEL